MGDFLTFRKMLVPLLVEMVFVLGTVICVVAGIVMLVSRSGTGMARLAGLTVMLGGPLALRIVLELLAVLFAIQGTLLDIRDELRKK